MWLTFVLEDTYSWDLLLFKLEPRSFLGLLGIITSPFIHADVSHLVANTVPFLFLGITLYYNYPNKANLVFLNSYLVTGLMVWTFGRSEPHIGASGIIYALASFIIAYGLLKRDTKALIIACIVSLFYGSIFYGVLPYNQDTSWESHLSGTIVGIFLAVYGHKKD